MTTANWNAFTDTVAPAQMLITISGHAKDGKTHAALTAPGPIFVSNFDEGLSGVAEKFVQAGVSVQQSTYKVPLPTDGTVDQVKILAQTAKNQFLADVDYVLKLPGPATLVIDTHTEQWQMDRLAQFGSLQAMPYQYGPVNAEFRAFIAKIRASGKNCIFLRRLKKSYVNDNWNGLYEPAGYNDLDFEVDMNISTFRDNEGVFRARVDSSRHQAFLKGVEFRSDTKTNDICLIMAHALAADATPENPIGTSYRYNEVKFGPEYAVAAPVVVV